MRPKAARRTLPWSITIFTVGLLAVLTWIEAGAYRGLSSTQSTTVAVESITSNGQSTTLSLSAHFGVVDRNVQVVAFSVHSVTLAQSIVVFNDASIPYSGSSFSTVTAVESGLVALMGVQDPDISFRNVDASGLAATLRDTNGAPSTVILALTGTLPTQALAATTNLVTPWVDAGGIFVWAGDAIGYYSVSARDRLDPANPENLRAKGALVLLGEPFVSFPTAFGRVGTSQSTIAAALQLRYSQTSSGFRLDLLMHNVGLNLGAAGGGLTSVAFIPRGKGGFLLFGGVVGDPHFIADDIGRILLSGILLSAAAPAAAMVRDSAPGTTQIKLRVERSGLLSQVMLVATGSDTYPYFLAASAVRLAEPRAAVAAKATN